MAEALDPAENIQNFPPGEPVAGLSLCGLAICQFLLLVCLDVVFQQEEGGKEGGGRGKCPSVVSNPRMFIL